MRMNGIKQMSEVMRVQFEREYQAVSSIISQESELRNKMKKLDEQVAQSRDTLGNSHMFQAAGAQLLWQGWTARTRRQLNAELAQVLVKKLVMMDRVRIAFGRQHAVDLVQKDASGDPKR